jgi:hypothetical protein
LLLYSRGALARTSLELIEDALNGRSPSAYDVLRDADGTERWGEAISLGRRELKNITNAPEILRVRRAAPA